MNALQLLEEKISSLVAHITELKDENKRLQEQIGSLSNDHQAESAKYEKLAEENAQLRSQMQNLEKKALEGDDQINELNQEKALTKVAVDDLLERLKSIDSLIEKQ